MKWAEDKDAAQCQQCNQPFSLARRKVQVLMSQLASQLSTPFCHPAQVNKSCHFPTCVYLHSRLAGLRVLFSFVIFFNQEKLILSVFQTRSNICIRPCEVVISYFFRRIIPKKSNAARHTRVFNN